MKKTMPSGMDRRKSSTLHYQTFPNTQPPRTRGKPPVSRLSSAGQDDPSNQSENNDESNDHHQSPLPMGQLLVLAVIALAEQTALNSISPYLPQMASTFPEVDQGNVGLYVGIIASSFAVAQFATNFFWGWLSDRIGRKPVILLGTFFTAACFCAFGFCRTLWQAVLVQVLLGLMNGNSGVVSTCLGEITDRSNQSAAFVYLPVIYGIGGITGPALGGLLVMDKNPFNKDEKNPYPYLLPNLVSSVILLIDLVVAAIWLEESLEEAKDLPPLKERVENLFAWLWQFTGGSRSPTYVRRRRRRHSSRSGGGDSTHGSTGDGNASDRDSLLSMPDLLPHTEGAGLTSKEVFNRNTIFILATYLIFQLSNISFNSLYPIFGAAPEPTGRELSPEEIGLSMSFAGLVTIIFQVLIFGKLKEKMGNKVTYRLSLFLFFLAMMMMPWVGYRDSKGLFGIGTGHVWLWTELGFVLLVKTVAAVGGLTSALLLITNSARSHSVLGTLNGLAQTLSAAGRGVGPFLSGGLFSISTRVKPKGEALAWGVFGGIAFLGFVGSFGIRGAELESEEFDGDDTDEEGDDDDEEGGANNGGEADGQPVNGSVGGGTGAGGDGEERAS